MTNHSYANEKKDRHVYASGCELMAKSCSHHTVEKMSIQMKIFCDICSISLPLNITFLKY